MVPPLQSRSIPCGGRLLQQQYKQHMQPVYSFAVQRFQNISTKKRVKMKEELISKRGQEVFPGAYLATNLK